MEFLIITAILYFVYCIIEKICDTVKEIKEKEKIDE